MPHVLIVDGEMSAREALAGMCAAEGWTSSSAASLREARLQAMRQQPALVLAEVALPDGSGLELFHSLADGHAVPPRIVLVTSQPGLESAVASLRLGALDYLAKPLNLARLRSLLAKLARSGQENEARSLRLAGCLLPLSANGQAGRMLGASAVMQTLYHHIERVAPTEATVLLLGESGTGKELAAQTIHLQSARKQSPFLPVNCGAISPQLIESEIFGHEKGSFTGAEKQHKGYFERANGGTLFLDEITEMPVELQVKLLRVLETGAFMRIGSNQEIETSVRVIAASNRDPQQAIAAGKLRLDLYHRLNVFPLLIPPLRERGADIELLAQSFLDELNATHGSSKSMSAEALLSLSQYHWPGNVRELRNHLQRAFILSDRSIDAAALAPAFCSQGAQSLTMAIPVGTSLAEADRKLIFATLEMCGGVKKRTADILGISLKTLYNRLEEYGACQVDSELA